jgi:hypothetical protein
MLQRDSTTAVMLHEQARVVARSYKHVQKGGVLSHKQVVQIHVAATA